MKGVIFDFNGTLFFDSDKQEEAWRQYLKREVGREVSDLEFKEYVHGRNNTFILRHFIGSELAKDQIDILAEEKEIVYRDLCLADKSNFRLVDGAIEFLDFLKGCSIPVNIATSAGKKNVQFFYENFNLAKWFDFEKVVFDDGKIPGKPEPAIYQKAAKNINVFTKDCIVFEDAKAGIVAAERAGIGRIIGVASTSSPEQFQNITSIYTVIQDYKNIESLIYD